MFFHSFSNKLLNTITAKTKNVQFGSGECYLGLCSQEPDPAGTTYEITGEGYERIRLALNSALSVTDVWGSVANGTVQNITELVTRECKDDNGWTATHFAIFDAKTKGNPLVYDVLRDANGVEDETTGLKPEKVLEVAKGQVAVFRAGDLVITFK